MAQEVIPDIELLRDTEAPLFVINLCASTTPVALAHPDHPELKRFTFFVTRRREEGRERFRLHMGYFDKLDAAETLLPIVRDVYPAAWVGPAPGNKGVGARGVKVAPNPVAPAAARAARPISVAPANPIASPAAKPAADPAAQPITSAAAKPATTVAAKPAAPALAAAAAAIPPTPAAARIAAPPVPPAALEIIESLPAATAPLALETMSNVREVIAQLGDESRGEAAVSRTAPPVPSRVPELTLESTGRHAVKPPSLSDSQVLRVLEARREPPVAAPIVPSDANAETSIRMITPEDTQTLRDIKLDVQSNASVSFAVQLQWSVQPIEMNALPALAIFDAYTLYTVEGNRQGRRWYGLRLGFFTDAMSAKQVAYYVRSEFASVAVVPVTAKERDRASGKGEPSSRAALDAGATGTFIAPALAAAAASASRKQDAGIPGFKLLDNDEPPAKPAAPADAHGAKAKGGKSGGKRPAVRGRAARGQQSGAPQTLEQTLEVLGASTLTIDESRTIINDSGVRHLDITVSKKKPSRFSRLLERLAEKM